MHKWKFAPPLIRALGLAAPWARARLDPTCAAMSDPATVSTALQALRQVLERRRRSGQTHVALSPDSLDRLRGLPGRIGPPQAAPVPPPAAATPARPPAPSPRKALAQTASPPAAGNPSGPAAAPPARATPPSVAILRPPPGSKAEQIAWLAREAEQCQACRSLGTLRDTMVFSTGNPEADLMFVGEAPGHEEERQGEPFVGPAGQLLTKIIVAMGLRRPEDVYISNIVKFRPSDGDPRFQGTRNRKPTAEEMAAAVKYVRSEIEVVRPRVLVAVGATAAEGLLNLSGSVASLRGRFHDLDGIPVMVTYHPSYLLRSGEGSPDKGKAEKRKVWEDMLQVMERLGLPVSERQRRFFQ